MPMDITELQSYLHEHIPLSKAMGVEVEAAGCDEVCLAAPLAPNINHRETVFGGSASTLATLAAWSLLYLRLEPTGCRARLVIQRHVMNYPQPMAGRFSACARLAEAGRWDRFLAALRRGRRARIAVSATVRCVANTGGQFEGEFVALPY